MSYYDDEEDGDEEEHVEEEEASVGDILNDGLEDLLKYVALQLLARYFDPPCTRLMIFAEFTKDLDVGNWAQIELPRVNLQPRSKSLTFLGKET